MPELRKQELVQGPLQPLRTRGVHQVPPAGYLQGLQEREHAASLTQATQDQIAERLMASRRF